ncbi:type VII secretion system-associated protein [Actinosynnema sp. CA-299493]
MEDDSDVENWFLMMDPTWEPESEDEAPPLEAVVGLWPVLPDGGVGPFRANPSYVPSDPDSPADPLDAVLRMLIRGEAEAEQLQLMLRDSLFDIAMNGDERPLILRSPDDVPCVVIATAEVHRRRVSSPEWRRIDLTELVTLLADDVDVLFNPGGPASARLIGDFMRRALTLPEEQVNAAYERFREGRTLEVLPWDVPPAPSGAVGAAPAAATVIDPPDLPVASSEAPATPGAVPSAG